MNLRIIAATIAVHVTKADLTVLCQNNDNPDVKTLGGLNEYKSCADCQCYVFDLLCLEESADDSNKYELYSRSLDYANSCKKCNCNSNTIQWSYQLKSIEGISETTRIPLASYDLFFTASKVATTPNYAKDVISYITDNKSRSKPLVNSSTNEGDDRTLPRFFSNTAITPSSCGAQVSCDLLYDLDWSYRLRTELSCAEAAKKNPCFATNACLCNNGYYAVSAAMPDDVPSDFSGDTSVLEAYKRDKA